MAEPKRNHPCPCGSGKKYKKCCGRSQTMEPKNTFRDEIEAGKVSEQEMLERDQRVTYLWFKCQAEVLEADHQHTQEMIERLKAFGNEIFKLPDSEGREATLEENKKRVEANEKQLAAQSLPRAQRVLLSILDEKFGKPTTIVEPPSLQENDGGDVSPELKDD